MTDEGQLPKLKPFFFKEVPHPYLNNNEILDSKETSNPVLWQLIEGEGDNKGYWERRENNDWSDMPNLFGQE